MAMEITETTAMVIKVTLPQIRSMYIQLKMARIKTRLQTRVTTGGILLADFQHFQFHESIVSQQNHSDQ